jgi:uncharacterized protein YuzE
MNISVSSDGINASIYLTEPVRGTDRMLDDDTIVTVESGSINAIEILNARAWGEPFDEAAAERVIAWVRERLRSDATRS